MNQLKSTNLINNEKYADDILRPLDDEELLSLISVYAKNMPYAAIGYYVVLNQYKFKEFLKRPVNRNITATDKFLNIFYTHRYGNLENGTYVCLTHEGDYQLSMFTLEPDCTELIECVRKTKRIQWDLGPLIPALHFNFKFIIDEIVQCYKLEIENPILFSHYLLKKEIAKDFDYILPDGYKLEALKVLDADCMNSIWPHRNKGSLKFVRELITVNGGFGIYNENNQLVSWSVKNEFQGIGMLQTIKDEQEKGFGKIVLKALCKKIADEDDLDVFAFIVEQNSISQKLLGSLGFEAVNQCYWIKIIPKKS